MSNYLNLIGKPYIDGLQDCLSVIRDYYFQTWNIEIPNYARPNRFWEDPFLDLYKNYGQSGFYPVFDGEYREGDLVLMPIMSVNNSHGAIVVGDNLLLHHLPNQLSGTDPLRPKWSNRITVHLRHPEVTRHAKEKTIHLHEVIDADILRDPRVQAEIEKLMESVD